MYLVNWNEQELVLEASLGGRITVEEMAVFNEDLQEVIEEVNDRPFLVVIDYSRARAFDVKSEIILNELHEFCLENGAEKVVSVVRDSDDKASVTTAHLQHVLTGALEIRTESAQVEWVPPVDLVEQIRRAA